MNTLQKTSLFWDVNLDELDSSAHADFIIRRVLARGDMDDIQWMFKEYEKEKVKSVFLDTAQTFDPKSLNFWCLYFGIDKKSCTQTSSTQTPSVFLNR